MRAIIAWAILLGASDALTVRVDYRFDTTGFFNNPMARAALEAAAARWSRVISEELLAVDLQDDDLDRRIQFFHPSTGQLMQASAAAGPDTDQINEAGAGVADLYLDGFVVEEDVWLIFAGAQDLPHPVVGRSGTIGPGANFAGIGTERDGFLVRGVEFLDLPLDLDGSFPNSQMALGGTVSADTGTSYHFDMTAAAESDEVDFYSVMLHEIGHTFGLASGSITQWRDQISGSNYVGANVVAAYEADTGLAGPLAVIGGSNDQFDGHFVDGAHQSKIFPFGQPSRVGTVALNALQDLLMESGSTIGTPISRYEITNVDAAAMRDIGWSVIEEDPFDGGVVVELVRTPGGEVRLIFDSTPGESYFIQTSLTGGNWVNVQPPIASEGTVTDWIDGEGGFFDPNGSAAETPRKFYRVVRP